MVDATGADGAHDAGKSERVQFFLVQSQVFITPTRLFGAHPFAFAKALLGPPHPFDGQHGTHGTAHVQDLADFLARAGTLALVVHQAQNVFHHLGVWFGPMLHRDGVIALGAFAHVLHVGLGPRPPDAIHLFARVAGGLGFLERGRVHHAPAPEQHVVGFGLAHLQPRRFLVNARRRHRQQLEVKAEHGGTLLQQRNGFLAIG